MAKLAGDHVQVLVGGYELTGDSNRISIDESRDLFDITTFGDAVHKFSSGQRMMALQHAGFMNSAEGGSHPALQGAAVDGLFSLYLGQNAAPAVGDPVFSPLARQGRYGALPQIQRGVSDRELPAADHDRRGGAVHGDLEAGDRRCARMGHGVGGLA